MKAGKLQRSKLKCQDLCWKVHDRAQSFVLCSHTMVELRNRHVSIGKLLGKNSKLLRFACARSKTWNKELCWAS